MNKLKILVIIFIFSGFLHAKTNEKIQSDHVAVRGLINRIFPNKSGQFIIENISAANGQETFELDGKGDKIILRGSSEIALSKALNYYLTNYCKTSVSWYKSEVIEVPNVLPPVTSITRKSCRFEKRFFLNYCTFGYTMLWWQWDDWERLIDWMALNGINMRLAITGQEAIWQNVWRKFGMTDNQIRAFFTGPSHLPWQRMGNLDAWMGPLPQSFINHQFELQKKILKQERTFGMTPILPAFAGHIPRTIKDRNPKVKITSLGAYGDTGEQCEAFFLDPMEPLFIQIQKEFLKEQTKQFGTDHLYGADPFNEMTPPSWEPEYLAQVSKTIYGGMVAVDKQAKWIQMGWTFYNDSKNWTAPRLKAMLSAVPNGKMILLDYFCEKAEIWRTTDAFYGQPYVWCYLGNFGGNTQIGGPIMKIADKLVKCEKDTTHGNLYGIGSTLEGFGNSRIVNEWLFEYAWDIDASNVDNWAFKYAKTRCGQDDPVAEEAYKQLIHLIHNNNVMGCGLGNILQSRPRFTGTVGYTWYSKSAYNYNELPDILAQFLMSDKKSLDNPRFKNDIAQISRQVLANLAVAVRDSIVKSYKVNDKIKMEFYMQFFLGIIDDVDKLMSTNADFLLGKWIHDSREFGNTPEEKGYYEKDAKVLITTWGTKGNILRDYAARDLAGMMTSFYKKRWLMFFDKLRNTQNLDTSSDFINTFENEISEFEWNWCEAKSDFVTIPQGDPVEISKNLYAKYAKYFHLFTASQD